MVRKYGLGEVAVEEPMLQAIRGLCGRVLGGADRWLVVAVGVVLVLIVVVFAATKPAAAVDGPTPPELGNPVDGTQVVPHGGYATSTNMCLQCHDVHVAAGDYALMTQSSVTYVCATCHGLHGLRGTLGLPMNCSGCHSHGGLPDPPDPGGPGTIGTVSRRSAYDLSAPVSSHGISALEPPGDSGVTITDSDWLYSWGSSGPPAVDATTASGTGTASDTGGGLYCGDCHTAHGEWGQLVNNWDEVADEGSWIWWTHPTTGLHVEKVLHFDPTEAAWQVCDAGPTNCEWAQVRDSEDQLVSLYGFKVLSKFPNHSYATPQSYHTGEYNDDGAQWCGSCHPSRIDGSSYHNHATGCDSCHGNPSDGSSRDYPHTSRRDSLLTAYPDALCLTCHTVMP